MFRHNVAVMLVVFGLSLSASGQEETVFFANSTPLDLKTFHGLSLKGNTVVLPDGQTVEKVVGLQKCGIRVLIVGQREVGVYQAGRNSYSVLPLPTPLSPDGEFALIPFNAAESTDSKAGEQTAFVAVKESKNTTVGVYRYEVKKPKFLQYVPSSSVAGQRIVDAELWSWHTYERDPREIRIGFDSTNGITYYYITWSDGEEHLRSFSITPNNKNSITGRRLAAIKAKFEERQIQVAVQESSATDTVSTSGEPNEK